MLCILPTDAQKLIFISIRNLLYKLQVKTFNCAIFRKFTIFILLHNTEKSNLLETFDWFSKTESAFSISLQY